MRRKTRRHLAAGLAVPPRGPATASVPPEAPMADPQRLLGLAGLPSMPLMPWAFPGAQPVSELMIACHLANRAAGAEGKVVDGYGRHYLFGWRACVVLGEGDGRLLLSAHNTRRRVCEALSGSINPADWPSPGMDAPATLAGVNQVTDSWDAPQLLPPGMWPGWPDGWALLVAPHPDGFQPSVSAVGLRGPEEWLAWARRHRLALLRTR